MNIDNTKNENGQVIKRKSDVDTSDITRRVKSRIKTNQSPRIPVRSTIASRSTENAKRASITSSIDSSTSTSSSVTSSHTVRNQQRNKSPGLASSRNLKRFKADASSKVTAKSLPKAIPSWDTKGYLNKLQSQLNEQDEEISEIEKLQNDLQSSVESKESLLREAKEKVIELEDNLKINQNSI
ncbi:uncharacterized protein BX663DRAFT_112057 [Cokeromyces recurvatus]|uniref:uncharacterized protein n=1 Tax=Cokeromyces recurvatus TaxID=90255 RepID=UPI0022208FF3|nr:uncharacterized protein BX663DRAFT_112057 [Cokeromyces recurvatus]KAI7901098.1 hypothetical protein BX663DRAFT_112057 [Cokeromyces recurvatus]